MRDLLGWWDERIIIVGVVLLVAILEILDDVGMGMDSDVLARLAPDMLEAVWLIEPWRGGEGGVLAATASEARWLIVSRSRSASSRGTIGIMHREGVVLVDVSQQANEYSGRGDDGDDKGGRLR